MSVVEKKFDVHLGEFTVIILENNVRENIG